LRADQIAPERAQTETAVVAAVGHVDVVERMDGAHGTGDEQ
jgi:hypothetical protein